MREERGMARSGDIDATRRHGTPAFVEETQTRPIDVAPIAAVLGRRAVRDATRSGRDRTPPRSPRVAA
ncbi:MAG: hypothetical protein J0L88_11145 [Xanthomonadales bacterium]|nr:hypothetical protein [Xanthomonadales bacterium]